MTGPAADADLAAVTELLGRPPRGAFEVVLRDDVGGPVVIRNAPLLADGTPMPTTYWLVGRAEREAVSRLEAAGGVRRMEAAIDPALIEAAHLRYAAEREEMLVPGSTGPLPSGGVGGARRGVKCLHAHLAWFLAGGDDPVGRLVASELAGPPVAAIDIGTNSTRLLVAAPWPFGGPALVPLWREMRITRLGEGVDSGGRLADVAIERTLTALAGYRQMLDVYRPVAAMAAATSAARDASNGDDLLDRAHAVLGVRPEILPGEVEGRLAFAGATAGLPPEKGPYLVLDVGGGSTELIAGGADGRVGAVASLDVGCVRLTERFLRSDPPSPPELASARLEVSRLVRGALESSPELRQHATLVGLAGTVSALVLLDKGAACYARRLVHHALLGRRAVERMLRRLAALSLAERRRLPALEPGRADVLVGGAAVLAEAMAVLGTEELVASESDILDGIAASLVA